MEPVWRMFIAIPLPDEVKKWIKLNMSDPDTNKSYKRLTDAQDYHITVQFLGDAAASRVSEIVAGMQAAVASQSAFELQAMTWNTFGRVERPRVLWMDVEGDRESLHTLQQQVGIEMDKLGFAPESRAYHPHITTARQYQGEADFDLQSLRKQLMEDRPCWTVDRLVLYRTRLGQIPMYEIVGEAPFTSART